MKKIYLPITSEDIENLKAGDEALLTGSMYTARDVVHKIFVEGMKDKQIPPIRLYGATLYYAGPTPGIPPRIIGSCGPTTSSRMDKFTPALLDAGVKAMVGKGRRSEKVRAAIKKHKAVYFLAPAGCGALLGNKIKKARIVGFPDLGSEAIYELEVEDFPVIVGIDSKGNDIFKK
ncbi:MAG: FumA C-terminus/TtdB family hydratase beta subunit [Candidatus Omnitrophica bacterium]|nr:FumA C-terminus/TtdB family hydratase beta subunit [Candidatus Omnitrophota bacterium]MBU4487693.1 FumA C-terminus/TtdB family hydratase beta subunit [Candidatus Omnitrophota bacterium]MCG2704820.1 FumA C-terminus/TtdB family hydratase beta subunit [Candidatus Omnitrophota bacterium]